MNLLLLEPDDFVRPDRVRLTGRRLEHVRQVLGATPGDSLAVGVLDGQLGSGRVRTLDEHALELDIVLDRAPPAPSRVRLVLALPRPPSLRRVLQQATAQGVKQIVLLHAQRVEKSYWQSHGLREPELRAQLLLGLEQAGDTIVPRVEQARRFRPFVEDRLPGWLRESRGLVAHPEADTRCPSEPEGEITLIVGPEGGWVPFELDLLARQGTEPVALGERVLRVETAVVALLARLGV